MAEWFWFFVLYSFIGFVLEVLFARVMGSPKRDRKCFYLLPLCPMYGLGALFILWLPPSVKGNPLLLFFLGGLGATAAELLTGIFYEKAAGVRFWDYSHLPLNLGGHVCLLFTALWGLLALGLVYGVHPLVAGVAARIPSYFILPAALFLTLDMAFTLLVLRREGHTDALKWYRHAIKAPPSPSPRRRRRLPRRGSLS